MDRTPGWNQATYQIPVENNITLEGNLSLPENPHGVVLFAHGSGSSRHSPRNQFVAQVLHETGFATLLIGMIVIFPVLGHATWHAYRDLTQSG